jgi:hypothetical protein
LALSATERAHVVGARAAAALGKRDARLTTRLAPRAARGGGACAGVMRTAGSRARASVPRFGAPAGLREAEEQRRAHQCPSEVPHEGEVTTGLRRGACSARRLLPMPQTVGPTSSESLPVRALGAIRSQPGGS